MSAIDWTQTGATFSGAADGYRFTVGTVDLRSWWWSAFDSSGLTHDEKRGWATSESAARLACTLALNEMKNAKHAPPRARRTA